VITAVNLTAGNVYVEKASLNNRDIDMRRPFLQHTGEHYGTIQQHCAAAYFPSSSPPPPTHTDITNGGYLTFWMTDQPAPAHKTFI